MLEDEIKKQNLIFKKLTRFDLSNPRPELWTPLDIITLVNSSICDLDYGLNWVY
jgi:hypothetical protein